MSAYIVDKVHIDLLITAGVDLRTVSEPLVWSRSDIPGDFDPRQLDYTNRDEIGRMLWTENVKSLRFRYPNDGPGDRPGPVGFTDEHAETYTYESVPGLIDPLTVLSCIAGYEYQSCEHPGWPTSEANRFCDALRLAAIARLRGYDAQPWEFTDRRYFLTPKAV